MKIIVIVIVIIIIIMILVLVIVIARDEVTCGPFSKREGEKLGIRVGSVLQGPVRGAVIEGCGGFGATVVKEVVQGYLVDQWNRALIYLKEYNMIYHPSQ